MYYLLNTDYTQLKVSRTTYHKKNINSYQKEKFEEFEKNHANNLLLTYETVLEQKKTLSRRIRILDIGGASGNFAMALHEYFGDCEHDIYVLDITKYDTWAQYGENIHFIEGSSFELEKLFSSDSFDIIFVNYVFHHLIQSSWKKTNDGIRFMLNSINKLLADGGNLCVSECYYGRQNLDGFFSFMIYKFSTIKFVLIAKLMRKIGSKSAGVGVCFLSKGRWKKLFTELQYTLVELIEGNERYIKKLGIKEQYFYFILKNGMQFIDRGYKSAGNV